MSTILKAFRLIFQKSERVLARPLSAVVVPTSKKNTPAKSARLSRRFYIRHVSYERVNTSGELLLKGGNGMPIPASERTAQGSVTSLGRA